MLVLDHINPDSSALLLLALVSVSAFQNMNKNDTNAMHERSINYVRLIHTFTNKKFDLKTVYAAYFNHSKSTCAL